MSRHSPKVVWLAELGCRTGQHRFVDGMSLRLCHKVRTLAQGNVVLFGHEQYRVWPSFQGSGLLPEKE